MTATPVLHELKPAECDAAVEEMGRVLAPGGHIVITEFAPKPRTAKSLAFLAAAGVPGLAQHELRAESVRLLSGGNLGIYVLTPARSRAATM